MTRAALLAVRALFDSRRTVRVYTRDPVPQPLVRQLLEMAVLAPSAHNAQSWRFVVVERPEMKRRLAEAMAARWERDLRRGAVVEPVIRAHLRLSVRQFTQAPVLILPCLTMAEMDVYPDRRRRTAERVMGIQSVAAAVENLLLGAAGEGLGACWHCAPLFCQDVVRRVLRLPRDWEPQALVTIGYPGHNPPRPPRKPLEDVVCFI